MEELTHASLQELEAIISKGISSFIETGNALREIRDRGLYHDQGFKTFEDYCLTRWGFKRSRGYQLIDAAKVAENLSTIVDKPLNEAQARELVPLSPKQQREVAATIDFQKTTAKKIRERVQEIQRKPQTKRGAGEAAPSADPKQKRRVPEQRVQQTYALLLEFAARPQPVPRADISERLGGKSPRDKRRRFETFFDCAAHVPWVAIKQLDGGFCFPVNEQLKQLCEQQTPLPELNGWTPQDVVGFFRNLRRSITEKRAANKCERDRRPWNADASLKLELLNLVEFIETELDKVCLDRTHASPKVSPAKQAEKRLSQPSAGDADPTKGDTYVN